MDAEGQLTGELPAKHSCRCLESQCCMQMSTVDGVKLSSSTMLAQQITCSFMNLTLRKITKHGDKQQWNLAIPVCGGDPWCYVEHDGRMIKACMLLKNRCDS